MLGRQRQCGSGIPGNSQRICQKGERERGILQEVLAAARPRYGNMSLVVADSTEQLERRFEVVTNLADGRQISASITVVGRTPDSNHVLVRKMMLVALVYQLMRPGDQRQVVDMTEFVGHLVTEQPTYGW